MLQTGHVWHPKFKLKDYIIETTKRRQAAHIHSNISLSFSCSSPPLSSLDQRSSVTPSSARDRMHPGLMPGFGAAETSYYEPSRWKPQIQKLGWKWLFCRKATFKSSYMSSSCGSLSYKYSQQHLLDDFLRER